MNAYVELYVKIYFDSLHISIKYGIEDIASENIPFYEELW